MPAIKVYASSIKFMTEHIYNTFKQCGLIPSDITWILTAPNHMTHATKWFIRKAALEGGILDNKLLVILESEATLIYCTYLNEDSMPQKEPFSPITKYCILDAKENSVDITVQEVQHGGSIKPLFMVQRTDCGGMKVDEAFELLLQELVGEKVFKQFHDEYNHDFQDLLYEFGRRRETIQPNMSKLHVNIRSLLHLYKREHGVELRDVLPLKFRIVGGILILDPDTTFDLFSVSFTHIINHLEEVFHTLNVHQPKIIIIVGKLALCPLLHYVVQKKFPTKTVITPNNPDFAVLKGAVQYGLQFQIDTDYAKIDMRRFYRLPGNNPLYSVVQDLQNLNVDQDMAYEIAAKYYSIFVLEKNMIDNKQLKEITDRTDKVSYKSVNDLLQNLRAKLWSTGRLADRDDALIKLEHEKNDRMVETLQRKSEATEYKVKDLQSPLDEQITNSNELKRQDEDTIRKLEDKLSEMQQQDSNRSCEILHIGDKNRPHSLGTRFTDLFEDAYTNLYELLKQNDEETFNSLYLIVKVTYETCQRVSKEQFDCLVFGLTSPMVDPLKTNQGCDIPPSEAMQRKAEAMAEEFRKSEAIHTISALQKEILNNKVKSKILQISTSNEFEACVNSCVELIWYMSIQQPPMELVWAQPGDDINREIFKFIKETKKTKIRLTTWPAVFLHKDGPLVAHGYVVSV